MVVAMDMEQSNVDLKSNYKVLCQHSTENTTGASGGGETTDFKPKSATSGEGFSGDESKLEIVRSIDTHSAVILGARANYDFRRDGCSGCRAEESFRIKAIYQNEQVTTAEGRNEEYDSYRFRESSPVDTINFIDDVDYDSSRCDGGIGYSVYYIG
jgi:hypothetical protein